MYTDNTKIKIEKYIEQVHEISYNKLQYIGLKKKQIHNSNLYPLLQDLEKEGKIEIIEQAMNGKTYRVIKWKDDKKMCQVQ